MDTVINSGDILEFNKKLLLVESDLDLDGEHYAIVYDVLKSIDDLFELKALERIVVGVRTNDNELYIKKITDDDICKRVLRKQVVQKGKNLKK